MNYRIESEDELVQELRRNKGRFYVYILCKYHNGNEVPFYVGIGQGSRLFAHEREAKETDKQNEKLNSIRQIWEAGKELIRYIDDFYTEEPWHREAELIEFWGLSKDGSGILTNSQRYYAKTARSIREPELRKYAEFGNEFPPNFKRRFTKLMVGTKKPTSSSSVYGKIYSMLEKNPGVTGEELAFLLINEDFQRNKSAYTQNGQVSLPWLAGYIDGGFYQKNLCIQEYS